MSEEKDEDSKDKRKERKLDLSAANVGGTALASVTAAYLGSYLGAAGTMWGAALTSVVVTVGGKLYQRSLERTKEQAAVAKEKAALLRAKKTTSLAQQSLRFDGEEGERGTAKLQQPEVPDGAEQRTRFIEPLSPGHSGMHWPGGEQVVEDPTRRAGAAEQADDATRNLSGMSAPSPADDAATVKWSPAPDRDAVQPSRVRWRRWGLVGASSAIAFTLCMLVITGFEGISGRSLSGDGGTTIGQALRRPAPPAPQQPVPEQDEPVESSSEPEPSSQVEPSAEPSREQSAVPSTPVPEQPTGGQTATQGPTSQPEPTQGESPGESTGVVPPTAQPSLRNGSPN
ncbi:hypothetical protein HUO13_02695 [Saccharopolyspora erythraea]|uniref:hypothetical protein n=1 Tax=Saccharopolyspora erythraea TaxID=1836 RepID=UPI001BAB9F77|nr:hypothetical protein [Saccharopolyspora erythraea]QUG99855.1 hypothetical protein HUO13_02695 [Saccharopolyspora erythraea]